MRVVYEFVTRYMLVRYSHMPWFTLTSPNFLKLHLIRVIYEFVTRYIVSSLLPCALILFDITQFPQAASHSCCIWVRDSLYVSSLLPYALIHFDITQFPQAAFHSCCIWVRDSLYFSSLLPYALIHFDITQFPQAASHLFVRADI